MLGCLVGTLSCWPDVWLGRVLGHVCSGRVLGHACSGRVLTKKKSFEKKKVLKKKKKTEKKIFSFSLSFLPSFFKIKKKKKKKKGKKEIESLRHLVFPSGPPPQY